MKVDSAAGDHQPWEGRADLFVMDANLAFFKVAQPVDRALSQLVRLLRAPLLSTGLTETADSCAAARIRMGAFKTSNGMVFSFRNYPREIQRNRRCASRHPWGKPARCRPTFSVSLQSAQ